MKYYVTIYIDQLFGEITKDFEVLKLNFSDLDFTHTFLGLTKGKSPDELDDIDKELIQEKLKNKEFKLFIRKLVIIKQFIYIRSDFANSYLF